MQDVTQSPSPLTVSATARSVDRQGATSTIQLVLLEKVLTTLTPHMLTGSLSRTAHLVDISGRMQLDSLMMAIHNCVASCSYIYIIYIYIYICIYLSRWRRRGVR